MSNYGGGPRYIRPVFNERPGPRSNTPPNRYPQRNNLNDHRSPINKTASIPHPINSSKPTTDTTISTPSTSNSPSVQNPTTTSSLVTTSSTKLTSSETTSIENDSRIKPESELSEEQQQSSDASGQKRSRSEFDFPQQQINERKTTQGGRCRLFIGNVPSDLTQDEFQLLFGKYGELVEYFVNPSRGFGFIKLSSRHLAEQAKYDLDGYILRGKPLRVRFASQGATIKVKNLSSNVSNELLKEAFEKQFGGIDRAVVIVDDRGKSTGEGIIEFEKKPSAQKCLNECTERCFFLTSELRPVIVEPWDIRDEEDGLPEKSLARNAAYMKEREVKPRFAELNTIEQTIGLRWKELELQEKQLLEEVKQRMQYATEQVQVEIDQMYLEHESQMLREELLRRQEDLRRIDELRSQEIDRRRPMMSMPRPDGYNHPYHNSNASVNNVFHQNPAATNALQYNDFQYPNLTPLMQQASSVPANTDGVYTTNQVVHGYGLTNADFHHQQGFDRKRPRY